ncbi:MAG: hypothetical protein KF912_01440 [Phycisphaeraceae bacterium]|nr:hypothetical protein [Phycisphaeraceae bacterium]QYK48468.1 MAG: hypothetical protein KF838_01110 [Phycisphaeraceae bacterium]
MARRADANLPAVLVAVCAIASGGCETEEKIVRYRPILAAVPGAQSNTAPVGDPFEGRRVDPSATDAKSLVVELPDGEKVLVMKTGRQLMAHIINTIDANERDLFVEQVLSEATKKEFLERAIDPGEAFDLLKKRRMDIMKLFNLMPMGEYTPGVYMKGVGGGVQRLRVVGPSATDLRWNFMDMNYERGGWRLRWFGSDR